MEIAGIRQTLVGLVQEDGASLVILGLIAFLLLWKLFTVRPKRQGSRRRPGGWRPGTSKAARPAPVPDRPDMADPSNQLAAIAKVHFERRRLLNRAEFRVLLLLERVARSLDQGHRVMAQTSLGELIQPRPGSGDDDGRRRAFASINSKRLDFAVVDRFGLLVLAVEYQGAGHFHHDTFLRDAVKREALRRAGVPLLEIEKTWGDTEIVERIRAELTRGITPETAENESLPDGPARTT